MHARPDEFRDRYEFVKCSNIYCHSLIFFLEFLVCHVRAYSFGVVRLLILVDVLPYPDES